MNEVIDGINVEIWQEGDRLLTKYFVGKWQYGGYLTIKDKSVASEDEINVLRNTLKETIASLKKQNENSNI